MNEREPETLSDEEAAQLWARAADLQAKAEGKISPAPDRAQLMPVAGRELAHVRAAAVEAGISSAFVETALADLRVAQMMPGTKPPGPLAQRFLDRPPHEIVARRIIKATPAGVRTAMEAVVPGPPYQLTLIDQRGDPLDGGPMLFDIQSASNPFSRGFAFATQDAGIRRLVITLRPTPNAERSTEMVVHGPLMGTRLHLGVGTMLSSLAGLVGLGLGVAGGLGLVAVGAVSGILPVAAAAGALTGGGLGVKGFRALYRGSLSRVQGALDGLCGAVAVRAEGGWQGR